MQYFVLSITYNSYLFYFGAHDWSYTRRNHSNCIVTAQILLPSASHTHPNHYPKAQNCNIWVNSVATLKCTKMLFLAALWWRRGKARWLRTGVTFSGNPGQLTQQHLTQTPQVGRPQTLSQAFFSNTYVSNRSQNVCLQAQGKLKDWFRH